MKIYLVGGAVRDILMKKEPNDRDFVVVGSSVEEMLSKGFKLVGKSFPVFQGNNGEQYALARKDSKVSSGHRGFIVDCSDKITLEDDLMRRDLTINAMAMDENENLIDPYNFKKDLDNKVLRSINDSFKDDPLRAVRLARFKTLLPEFTIDDHTRKLVFQLKDELKELSGQRVFLEMKKAFESNKPSLFFYTLKDLGILDDVFQIIYKLIKIPENTKYHVKDNVFDHIMDGLDYLRQYTNDTLVLIGFLCHDLGKIYTEDNRLPNHYGHEHKGLELIKEFAKGFQIQVPKEWISFSKHHLNIYRALDLNAKTILNLLKQIHFKNDEVFNNILLMAKAGLKSMEKDFDKIEQYLRDIAKILKNVDEGAFVKKYYGKVAIKKLHDYKIHLIKNYMRSVKNGLDNGTSSNRGI